MWAGLLVSTFACFPLYTSKSRKGKCLSFPRSRMHWIDGSNEFKCDRRRSASFPDTGEITSSTYRFQKKGLTGEVAKALCSTSSITMLAMTAETGEPMAVTKTC